METKAKRLKDVLAKGFLPELCSAKERWHDRKCRDYCAVAANCPYSRMVKHSREIKFAAQGLIYYLVIAKIS